MSAKAEDQKYKELLLAEREYWSLYLHENQYYLGRLYIWIKRKGPTCLTELSFSEWCELYDLMHTARHVLTELFGPDRFNWAALGNLTERVHMHVIPRYRRWRELGGVRFTDERWGKNYAPYNYEFSIPRETLLEIRDMIRSRLQL